MAYPVNPNPYASMGPTAAGYGGGHGWAAGQNAVWMEPARPGGGGGFAGWGASPSVGMMSGGWAGHAAGPGRRGKARYNSVGPPPSITYEHQKVMAEEAASAPRVDDRRDDRRDDRGDRRRSFREEAAEPEHARQRRSFREEATEGSNSGEPMRRSFREAGQEDGRGGDGQGRAGEEGPAERSEGTPRKRRFVEFVADELPKPEPPRPDRDTAAGGVRGEMTHRKGCAGSVAIRYMKQMAMRCLHQSVRHGSVSAGMQQQGLFWLYVCP